MKIFFKSNAFFNLALIVLYFVSLILGSVLAMGINLLGLLGIPFFLIGIISINFAEFFANWAIYFKVKDPDWAGASDIAINKRYFLGGLAIVLAIFFSFASAMFL